jgi:hypothetical protein
LVLIIIYKYKYYYNILNIYFYIYKCIYYIKDVFASVPRGIHNSLRYLHILPYPLTNNYNNGLVQ